MIRDEPKRVSHCGTSAQPGVYLQSDALTLAHDVVICLPEHEAVQLQPVFELHEYCVPTLHGVDDPLHEAVTLSQ